MSLTKQSAQEIFSDLDVILSDINNDTYNIDAYDVYLKLWYKCYWNEIFLHLIFHPDVNCKKIDHLKTKENLIRK